MWPYMIYALPLALFATAAVLYNQYLTCKSHEALLHFLLFVCMTAGCAALALAGWVFLERLGVVAFYFSRRIFS